MENRRPSETEEDRLILELLEGGGPEDWSARATGTESEELQVLVRLHTEVLGLVAQSVEPMVPAPGGRERLLAAVRQLAPEAKPERQARLVPFEPVSGPAEEPHRAKPRRRPIWMAVAAGLGVVCLGGGLYFLQALESERSARWLAEQERDRAIAEVRQLIEGRETLSARLASLETEKLSLVQKLAWLSEPGAAICALKPPQPAVLAGQGTARAKGALVVAANHQHWFLRVSGLPELPADRAYHFWFLTKQGAVLGGTFQVAANADAEIGSPTMPTDLTGVAITVEPLAETTLPSGERVLFGDEMVIVA